MPLSHAVIKSALARKANKKKKNEGGLTTKNKAMAIPERRTGTSNAATNNIIAGRMGGKVSTATQGNAPRQNTAYKPTSKKAAPSNPSGSVRTAKTSGVNFIINKKKKAKKTQSNSPRLPNYRA